jgi:[ribosomal protein S5]-alanine N-acetyltransferase
VTTELSSRRLLLTPVVPEDLASLHEHWVDPGVRRYLWDGRSIELAQVQGIIDTSARLFAEHGAGLWAVRPAHGSRLIGCVGFWYFHEPPELELILSLAPACWGRGLAQEAAGTLLDHAFRELRWPAVQASADAPNRASLALMRRLGMRRSGERPGEFGVIEVYRITAVQWSPGA